MKRILAIAAAAAAITAGASAASAQSCDHGIVMHGNVPTTCGGANGPGDVNGNAHEIPTGAQSGHGGFFGSGTSNSAMEEGGANGAGDVNGNADELATSGQGNFANTEPVYTGSITGGANGPGDVNGNADQIPTAGGMRFVESRDKCQPGMFYMQDMQSQNRPQPC